MLIFLIYYCCFRYICLLFKAIIISKDQEKWGQTKAVFLIRTYFFYTHSYVWNACLSHACVVHNNIYLSLFYVFIQHTHTYKSCTLIRTLPQVLSLHHIWLDMCNVFPIAMSVCISTHNSIIIVWETMSVSYCCVCECMCLHSSHIKFIFLLTHFLLLL